MADLNIFARWHGADVKKGVEETKGAFAQLKTVAAGAMAGMTVGVVVNELKTLYKEAAADVTITQKLGNEMRRFGGTESEIRRVTDQIQSLTLSTGIADDQIATAFRRLLVATKSETEALKWLPLALDLAADRGMDAASAADAMAMASQGFMLRLSRMLPDIRALSKANSDLEGTSAGAAEAFRVLSAAFGGKAAENANTAAGALQRMATAWNEMKESFARGMFGIDETSNSMQKLADQMARVVGLSGAAGKAVQLAFLAAFAPQGLSGAILGGGGPTSGASGGGRSMYQSMMGAFGGINPSLVAGGAPGNTIRGDFMGPTLQQVYGYPDGINLGAQGRGGKPRGSRFGKSFGEIGLITDQDVSEAERLAKILEQPYEMAEANRKLAAEELQQLEDTLANSIGNAFMAAGGGVRSFARAIEQEVFRAIVRAISRALAGQIASAILGVATGGTSSIIGQAFPAVPMGFAQKQQSWRMQRGM